MAGLAQSKESGQAMADAAEKLSIFPDPNRKSKSAPPTADHLIAADKGEKAGGAEPKAGTFEKLSAMFGGGARFQLPASGPSE